MRAPQTIEQLYIDFDSFFASAEQQLQPALRGRPVGVLPIMSKHTCVIAASREAKKFGIRTGTSVREAKEKCPGIRFTHARHDEYVRMNKDIVKTVERHLPVDEVCSIDEVACTLLGSERAGAEDLARRIKRDVAETIGEYVTCSIGLAPNRMLAKTAAEMEKPDGLVLLAPDKLPGPLLNLKLMDFPGIGPRMERRLIAAGITDVAGLWALAPKHARRLWGSVEGERFWQGLHGFAVGRPPTERRMFGHGRVLSWDWRDPEKARACTRLLTVKAARRLRRQGFLASALSVSVRSGDDLRWEGTERFAHARDDWTFLSALDRLWRRAMADLSDGANTSGGNGHSLRIKKTSMGLHGLARVEDLSLDLFDAARPLRLRWDKVTEAMDRINKSYGGATIAMGRLAEPPGGYAGAKIAFGRIPDFEDF